MKGELYTTGEVRCVVSYLVAMNSRGLPREIQEEALRRIESKELRAIALAGQTAINMHNAIGLEGTITIAQGLKQMMGITDEEIEADLKALDEETRNKNKKGPDDLLKNIFDRSQN